MGRNSYSAGKRQRERDKEKKRKAKAQRRENRSSGGGIPIATVDEVQGGLRSPEEVLAELAGGKRRDASERASGTPMRLFVGGLDWRVSNEQLAELFATIGEVQDAFVVNDRDTGESRGFGFVTMDRRDAAEAIKKLDGHSLEGRSIAVRPATERK